MPRTGIFERSATALRRTRGTPRINYRKAITTSSAPEIIEPEVADRLIDFVEDESRLWGQARVERMNTNEKHLRFVDISQGLLRPGGCNEDNCDSGTVSGSAKTLLTKELRAVIPICDDLLEDNIEGASFEDHVLQMAGKQIANELELWGLMGSTALNYTSTTVNNATMALIDGFYEKMKSGHVIDGLTARDGTRFLRLGKFREMMQELPTKFRSRNLRYWMPADMLEDYIGLLQQRGTPLGDDIITGRRPAVYHRTPVIDLPLLPTDMESCVNGSVSPANGTFMFLADTDNLVLGIQRQITLERERHACPGKTDLVWKIRADVEIEEEDATVLYDCLQTGDPLECACPGDSSAP